jgi:hypothetical protein
MKVIEDCGAVIVADTLCFGSRSYSDLTEEDGDPAVRPDETLSQSCLLSAHVRLLQGTAEKHHGRAREAKVDGIILQNIRFLRSPWIGKRHL